ncbi:MAG: ATP-binding protein [Lachnospiraceae bacterium]|nr:ATP-binding protein [Lachnospiraceae bacterium]
MAKRIFRNTFITSLCGIILASLIVMGSFYDSAESQMRQALRTEANLVAQAIVSVGESYFDKFSSSEGTRITWISADGKVLYDSQVDETTMDNHISREEIALALKNGQAEVVRQSDTLSEKTMYYAKLLDDGTIIRVSCGYDTVMDMLIAIVQPMILLLLVLCVIMYAVANYTAKAVVAPLNGIDLESGTMADVRGFEEIKPLLARIRRQNVMIDTNIRELKLEHAKREDFRRDFTANISHELKTPLTSISGVSEMLMNGIIRTEDVPEFAANINKEAGRLISLVNDIILISRLEAEDLYTQKEQVDIFKLALSVKNRLEVLASKRNIKLTVTGRLVDGTEISENDSDIELTVMGVYNMLEDMIVNLCDNAIKYNVENGKVDISIIEHNKQMEIVVEDTGIGISDEDKGSVFERFYRVDKSRSKEVGGTGLGLSIVKHIVMYHGGSVNVEDRVGGGTRMVAIINK